MIIEDDIPKVLMNKKIINNNKALHSFIYYTLGVDKT